MRLYEYVRRILGEPYVISRQSYGFAEAHSCVGYQGEQPPSLVISFPALSLQYL
ncbi:hypothetical protein N9M64_01150 [bacterium]|nr:hypothetical protein [bacterium]